MCNYCTLGYKCPYHPKTRDTRDELYTELLDFVKSIVKENGIDRHGLSDLQALIKRIEMI